MSSFSKPKHLLLEGMPLLFPDHGLLVHVVDARTFILHPQDDGDVRDRTLQKGVTELSSG